MKEIWKDIKDYEGYYQISNLGRVKGIERYTSTNRYLPERIMKQRMGKHGYYRVNLAKDGMRKTIETHRLVAIAFIPNPYNYPEVNHKDECKANDCADNLEWCTALYNNNYGTSRVRQALANKKGILQLNMDGKVIKHWNSAIDIQHKLGYNQGNIGHCARGEYSYAYGYKWKYA